MKPPHSGIHGDESGAISLHSYGYMSNIHCINVAYCLASYPRSSQARHRYILLTSTRFILRLIQPTDRCLHLGHLQASERWRGDKVFISAGFINTGCRPARGTESTMLVP